MKLDELIELADRAYGPDSLVLAYHQEPDAKHGDGLAKFLRDELVDTYDETVDEAIQIQTAVACIEQAIHQMNFVAEALDARYSNMKKEGNMKQDPDCKICCGEGVIEEDDYRESTGHFTREKPCACMADWEPEYCVEPYEYDGSECHYRDTTE